MSLPPIVVPSGLSAVVNVQELYHVVLSSLGSNSLVGVAIEVVSAVLAHASTVFVNPSAASVAIMFLSLLLDLLRSHLPAVPLPG